MRLRKPEFNNLFVLDEEKVLFSIFLLNIILLRVLLLLFIIDDGLCYYPKKI